MLLYSIDRYDGGGGSFLLIDIGESGETREGFSLANALRNFLRKA
jgi:hypothetical protein